MFQKSVLTCYKYTLNHFARMSTNVSIESFQFRPKFTEEEKQKILSTVNEAHGDELTRYDVTRQRIKNLEVWRKKNGPFQSLSDILEVEGLGEKVLERLCKSIINNEAGEVKVSVKKSNANSKYRRNIIAPPMCPSIVDSLNSAVGIHLAPTGVSWAKLNRDGNKVESWNFHDFSLLPKKLLPLDTFNLAVDIISNIPTGDIYVMEALNNQTQPNGTYNQHLELSSMLLALLNTSSRHNPLFSTDSLFLCNNMVYYLRANLPARLFQTLVGTEKVAVTGIIDKLMSPSHKLPCSSIKIKDKSLENIYNVTSPPHKDIMGQALLLVITFMDLCIYKNERSFAAIAPGRRNN